MIIRLLLIPLLFLSLSGVSQKMPADYYEEGGNLLNTGHYLEAIPPLKYIVDNYSKFSQYAAVYYDLGVAYYGNKQYSEAILVFKNILEKDAIETVDYSGDIMENPYSNFKNGAAYMISKSYFDTQQYDSALYYQELSETVHTFRHFCGNAIAQNEVSDQIYKAKIYLALGKKDYFEKTLLTYTFLTEEYSNEVLILLKNYYKTEFKGKTLLKEAKKAFGHIEKEEDPKSKICRYFITFHQTRILVSGSFDQFTKLEGKPTTKDLMQSAFYKMLLQVD